jgi:Flp pilus assembly protein TadG
MKVGNGARQENRQSGQTLILLAILAIGIFGLAGLAIDAGFLYTERRRAQNAADTAALAAALARIRSEDQFAAAFDRLSDNGFPITQGECSPSGVDCASGAGDRWSVTVEYPPRSGDNAGSTDHTRVSITTQVAGIFSPFVFSGTLETTVEAVSYVKPRMSISPGNAIHAASDHGCKPLWFAGTSVATIQGGDVFSNSDASSAECAAGFSEGSAGVQVSPEPYIIRVVGSFKESGSGSVDPPPVEGVDPVQLEPVAIPDCSGLPDYGVVKIPPSSGSLEPGWYESIEIGGGSTVTLDPGMYCIYGSDGISTTGAADISGSGVLIYLQDGGLNFAGGSAVDLVAEHNWDVLVDPSANDWKGMLIYADPGNTSTISMEGNASSTYEGTIYAPSSLCTFEGTGSASVVDAQMICDKVRFDGDAEITISYSASKVFKKPPEISLAK